MKILKHQKVIGHLKRPSFCPNCGKPVPESACEPVGNPAGPGPGRDGREFRPSPGLPWGYDVECPECYWSGVIQWAMVR